MNFFDATVSLGIFYHWRTRYHDVLSGVEAKNVLTCSHSSSLSAHNKYIVAELCVTSTRRV